MSAAGEVICSIPKSWPHANLKSDIIAEVDCPYSGILKYEELMPMPNLHSAVVQDGLDETVMKHYNLQLVLRKHLNQLHGMFYKPPGSSKLYLSDRNDLINSFTSSTRRDTTS